MNEIIKRLESYEPSKVVPYSIPIGKLDYTCPPEIDFTELTHCKVYAWNGHKVSFYYREEPVHEYFSYVDRLLWLLQPTTPMVIDILLTSAKKFYPPNRIFGPSHVNTGYSSTKIVVYRKEEWFKVLIHECFHFLNFEAALFKPSLRKEILALYKVNSDVNLYESYCELWARTLNCCMISVCKKRSLTNLLYHEKRYAVRHMVNVLAHMGFTYEQLFTPCDYQEETNVLAYVVITAVLLYHDFIPTQLSLMPFTLQDTEPYVHFIPTHLSLMPSFTLQDAEPYVHFIQQHYRSQPFLDFVRRTQKQVTTTMSLYDITKM